MRRSRAEPLRPVVLRWGLPLLLVVAACGQRHATAPARATCDGTADISSQADVTALASCTSLPQLIIKTAATIDLRPMAHLEAITGELRVGPTVSLDEVALPALRRAGSIRISANGTLRGVFLPALERAERIEVLGNVELTTLSLPKLIRTGALSVTDNVELQVVDLSALAEVPGDMAISGSPHLDVVEAPKLPAELVDRLRAR